MEKACVHIYCGNGKGKTTAAVGLLTRASGAGKKCLLAQFLKTVPTAEVASLEKLGVKCMRAESAIKKFIFAMDDAEKVQYTAEQRALFEALRAEAAKGYDLIVMDEVLDAVSLGIVCEDALAEMLGEKGSTEIVLTGREPGEKIAQYADYHTCMQPVKHPYEKGLCARKGIEF